MSAIITGATAGLITNALTGIFTRIIKWKNLDRADYQKRLNSINVLIEKDIAAYGQSLDSNKAYTEGLRKFLSLHEVVNFTTKLLTALIQFDEKGFENHEDKDKDVFEKFFNEFDVLYVNHMGKQKNNLLSPRSVYNDLLKLSKLLLRKSIDAQVVSVLELQSEIRYKTIKDFVKNIDENISFFKDKNTLNHNALSDFVLTYCKQLEHRYSKITTTSFDYQRMVHIDKLFIAPSISNRVDTAGVTIIIEEVLRDLYRDVILGNPGGGKTTFSQKIVHSLAMNILNDPENNEANHNIPIFITLRDYDIEASKNGFSIIEYIEHSTKYHLQIRPPAGAFEYFLRTGRCVVIFDGLDELLNVANRVKVKEIVESFCNMFKESIVLVSSRIIGYEQAPLDRGIFRQRYIAALNDNQVSEYAEKWFALEERPHEAKHFLKESRNITDILENPLMLSLLCNLYKGPNTLPKTRPDLYEKCALMLFRRWDKDRNINIEFKYESHLLWTIQKLAYNIYTDTNYAAGIPESRLIMETEKYLLEKCTNDEAEANQEAKDLVSLLKGRVWVFTETGTTQKHEPIYEFTHRTFLEYFTAFYIARNSTDIESIIDAHIGYIAKQERDIVLQLLIHLISQQHANGADKFVVALVGRLNDYTPANQLNILSFIIRSLEFITPSPGTKEMIGESIIRVVFDYNFTNLPDRKVDDIIYSLMKVSHENYQSIQNGFFRSLDKMLGDGDSAIVKRGILATLSFLDVFKSRSDQSDIGMRDKWCRKINALMVESKKIFFDFYRYDVNIAVYMHYLSFLGSHEVLEHHGLMGLYLDVNCLVNSNIKHSSIAARICSEALISTCKYVIYTNRKSLLKKLEKEASQLYPYLSYEDFSRNTKSSLKTTPISATLNIAKGRYIDQEKIDKLPEIGHVEPELLAIVLVLILFEPQRDDIGNYQYISQSEFIREFRPNIIFDFVDGVLQEILTTATKSELSNLMIDYSLSAKYKDFIWDIILIKKKIDASQHKQQNYMELK